VGSQDLPTEQVAIAAASGRLLVATVQGRVVRVELPARGRLTVGRGEEADILLDHPSVSRRHVVLDMGELVHVEDQGSANGTILGGAKLAPFVPARFELGMVLEIGAALVLLGEATRAESAVPPPSSGGGDTVMGQVREIARVAAQSALSILLLGETGVGKEVLAQYIHDASPRRAAPLVKINCAALVETLLEAELFGHERGAFTGASQAKPGLFDAADGGTLFLDEVGELALTTQAKLLRVLESGEVTPVGGVKPHRVDVRFIAATHRDLRELVAERRFREDVFFRLDGLPIRVPPLRERRTEIAPLAEQLLVEAAGLAGTPPKALSSEAKARLEEYPWPGNVRELRNVLQRSILFCGGPVLSADDLRFDDVAAPRDTAPTLPPEGASNEVGRSREDRRKRVLEALDASQWNQRKAAERLGISRRTLQTWMIELSIPRPRAKT
jgi:transcriptional regulator with GAF, ATPase, and Fis domain